MSIVQAMSSRDRELLNTYINDENPKRGANNMEELINAYVEKNNISYDLDEKIENDGHEDLYSLCKQVINEKPRKEDKSLVKHWGESTHFFEQRSLFYKSPQAEYIRAPIKSRKIDQKNDAMLIEVMDQYDSSFYVKKRKNERYDVKVTKKICIPAIEDLQTMEQDVFFYVKKNNNISSSLGIGRYRIVKKEEKIKAGLVKSTLSSWTGNKIAKIDYEIATKIHIEAYEQEELSSKKPNRTYVITILTKKDSKAVGLLIDSEQKDKTEIYSNVELHRFKKGYSLSKEVYEEASFSKGEFKKAANILDERDENAINVQYRTKAEETKKEVIGILAKEKVDCNNQLIDIIIEKGLVTLDDIKQENELVAKISEIETIYTKKLGEKVSFGSILMDLSQRALFVNLIPKDSIIDTEIFVELLQDAYCHIDRISNRDILLLLGNTGAGKSATASYLIGEKLKFGKNDLGIKIVEKKTKDSKGPKIGQRVGSSETSYAQGFSVIKDQKIFSGLIVDCPGFGDTRGSNHTLCANLSIDQAVVGSKSIKGVILVVPVGAFLVDRGNPVFNLIKYIKDKFPQCFDTKNKDFACFHMLITKENQCDPEVVVSLRNGKWVRSIIRDISNDMASIDHSNNPQSSRITNLKNKKDIWEALEELKENNRITFIDIRDQDERKQLLHKYGNGTVEIDKKTIKLL